MDETSEDVSYRVELKGIELPDHVKKAIEKRLRAVALEEIAKLDLFPAIVIDASSSSLPPGTLGILLDRVRPHK